MISQSVHLIPRTLPSHGPLDRFSFPFSGRMCHSGASLGYLSIVCEADSRRNPNFLKKNNQGFSRGRGRQIGDPFVSENFDESESVLSSKNGPMLSLSGSPKFQATAAPGPREKEIVELFRKVQVRLRERAAAKEVKKIESSEEKDTESETVDSLLNLLRKHSINESSGNRSIKSTSGGGGDSRIVNHQKSPNGSFHEEQNQNLSSLDSNGVFIEKSQEQNTSARPLSKFRRKSPVPKLDLEPTFSSTINKTSTSEKKGGEGDDGLDPVSYPQIESDTESESDDLEIESDELGIEPESVVQVESELDEKSFELEGVEDDGKKMSESRDLASLKMSELRSLAKSCGVKGFSKLKKSELVDVLSKTSN